MPEKKARIRTGLSRRDFEARLVARAWKDPAFRERLVQNPKKVYEEELGVKLAPTVEIRVLEEGPTQLYLVLPPNPEQERELSENELEMVSGGSGVPMFLLGMISQSPS